jgi:hypothetical protein
MKWQKTAAPLNVIHPCYPDMTDRFGKEDRTALLSAKRQAGVLAMISIAKKKILYLTASCSGSNNSARNQF